MSGLSSGHLILIIVLSVLLTAAVILTVRAFVEPFILKITTRKMYPGAKIQGFRKQTPSPDTANDKPGVRFFFFSDIHADICRIKPERLIEAIRKANSSSPLDAVIFGGDINNNYKTNETGLSYLREISSACSELGIPFYGVTGNHDVNFDPFGQDDIYECIENKQIFMKSRSTGKTVILCGLDDSGRKNRIWYKVPAVPSDAVSVVVIHNPDAILHFDESEQVDFMLSGHLHAGQVKMPFKLEFILLRGDKLPRRNVVDGVFEHNGTTLFISRGVGCNKLPIRLGATPEVSVVEIFV